MGDGRLFPSLQFKMQFRENEQPLSSQNIIQSLEPISVTTVFVIVFVFVECTFCLKKQSQ